MDNLKRLQEGKPLLSVCNGPGHSDGIFDVNLRVFRATAFTLPTFWRAWRALAREARVLARRAKARVLFSEHACFFELQFFFGGNFNLKIIQYRYLIRNF